MIKRLYDALKSAKDAAKVVAQLAEYEGYADAAAGVVAGVSVYLTHSRVVLGLKKKTC